jgi:tripartite ATP-independent transporter DctP family solute receptor
MKTWKTIGILVVLVFVSVLPSAARVAEAGQKMQATLASVNALNVIVKSEILFADKVRAKTNGGLDIKVVYGGALGGMKENFEAIMANNLELAQVNNAFLGTLYSGTMLFDLPFVFRDNEHMKRVVRGPIGQQVYGEFEKKTGMRILMTGLADGPRSTWNRKRAILSPDDMRGMKIRVMENPLMVDSFRALGAIPTPMAFPEVYMAAKQGVIDGGETPPFGVVELKAWEVAKYFSLTKHFAMPSGVGVSVKWFSGLPAEYQRAVMEAADEARAWYDAEFEAVNVEALKEMKKQGVEVNDVADIEQFRKAVKPVYDKYADRVGGWKMIQAVLDTK